MDPPRLAKLSHNGVDKGIASARVSPGRQEFRVVIPRYLTGHWVPYHVLKVRCCVAGERVKLTPQELSVKGYLEWFGEWLAEFGGIHLVQFIVESQRRQAPMLDVRTETSCIDG